MDFRALPISVHSIRSEGQWSDNRKLTLPVTPRESLNLAIPDLQELTLHEANFFSTSFTFESIRGWRISWRIVSTRSLSLAVVGNVDPVLAPLSNQSIEAPLLATPLPMAVPFNEVTGSITKGSAGHKGLVCCVNVVGLEISQ